MAYSRFALVVLSGTIRSDGSVENVEVNGVPFYFPQDIVRNAGGNFLVGVRPSVQSASRQLWATAGSSCCPPGRCEWL